MGKYLSTTHVTYNIGYHIVFCPKYRYNLLRYRAADELLASALLDRLLYRCEVVKLSGTSYGMENRKTIFKNEKQDSRAK